MQRSVGSDRRCRPGPSVLALPADVPLDADAAQRFGVDVHQLRRDLDLRRGRVELDRHLLERVERARQVASRSASSCACSICTEPRRVSDALSAAASSPRVRVVQLDRCGSRAARARAGLRARGLALDRLGLRAWSPRRRGGCRLPRCSRGRWLRRIVRSASCQPTLLSETLDVPCTFSATTMLRPVNSAIARHHGADVRALDVDRERARARPDQADLPHRRRLLSRRGRGDQRHAPPSESGPSGP